MSQYRVLVDGGTRTYVYGFDSACGYFIQVYNDQDEDPEVDLDSRFNGLSGIGLAEWLEGIDGVLESHLERMVFDLPF